jgi:hypothetical protein
VTPEEIDELWQNALDHAGGRWLYLHDAAFHDAAEQTRESLHKLAAVMQDAGALPWQMEMSMPAFAAMLLPSVPEAQRRVGERMRAVAKASGMAVIPTPDMLTEGGQ